jgi:hypothetical protein
MKPPACSAEGVPQMAPEMAAGFGVGKSPVHAEAVPQFGLPSCRHNSLTLQGKSLAE